MTTHFKDCKIMINSAVEGSESIRELDNAEVSIYNSGYVHIVETDMVLPPHRVIGIEVNSRQ